MAKLMIEIDIPDDIMEVAMTERSEEKIRKLCQILCQEEMDRIHIDLRAVIGPVRKALLKITEDRVRNGELTVAPGCPDFLRHIHDVVKSGESSLEVEFEEHVDELREWMRGKEAGVSGEPNPFDFFDGLIS